MIPGSVSKMSEGTVASADTITVKTDIIKVTGTTQVNTIIPGLGTGQSQFLILIPVTGPLDLGTSGNILGGVNIATNRCTILIFVKSLNKWVTLAEIP